MVSEQEATYHRSFLPPHYLDNLNPPGRFGKLRSQAELDAIRLNDPHFFEHHRKCLAQVLKVSYRPGYMKVYPGEGSRDHWVGGNPSDATVAECIAPTYPLQRAFRSPGGTVALPALGYTRKAYADGKNFFPVDMYEKMDQQFEDHATPWELVWSDLVYPYNRGFTPIVDLGWTVIGHLGVVQGGALGQNAGQTCLIVPRELAGTLSLEAALAQGVPVFVHRATGIPSGWANGNFHAPEHEVQVRTGIDGQVLAPRSTCPPDEPFTRAPTLRPLSPQCKGLATWSQGPS